MNDISAFRRSNALSPIGQMHARFAQNQAFGSQWIAKYLSPTLRAGSAAETAVRLARPPAIASALSQRTRPFGLAAEELNRRVGPLKGASELLEQRLRPFRGAAETVDRLTRPLVGISALDQSTHSFGGAATVLGRQMSTIKGPFWTQDPRIRALHGIAETIDRLTRELDGTYHPPSNPWPTLDNLGPTEIKTPETADSEIVGDLSATLEGVETYIRGAAWDIYWFVYKHHVVIGVALIAVGELVVPVLIAIYL